MYNCLSIIFINNERLYFNIIINNTTTGVIGHHCCLSCQYSATTERIQPIVTIAIKACINTAPVVKRFAISTPASVIWLDVHMPGCAAPLVGTVAYGPWLGRLGSWVLLPARTGSCPGEGASYLNGLIVAMVVAAG